MLSVMLAVIYAECNVLYCYADSLSVMFYIVMLSVMLGVIYAECYACCYLC
jgi:hypothetical protein